MIDRKYPQNDLRLKGILEALYNSVDSIELRLNSRPTTLSTADIQNVAKQIGASGLIGAFGQQVIGQTPSTDPFVRTLGMGNGTVTLVSVATANGFAGTVATPDTTPAITLNTTINAPVLAGNGTAISAATTTGSGSTVVLATSPTLGGAPIFSNNQHATSTFALSNTDSTDSASRMQLTITAGTTAGRVLGLSGSSFIIGSTTASDVLLQRNSVTVVTLRSAGADVTGTLSSSALTAGRVTYAGTSGVLSDDSGLTYNSATHALTTTTFIGALTGNASTASAVAVGGITGLGTGVATALAVNVGTAGAFVVNGGALGSPSSAGTLPAHTLGGTISGGGNQINNVVIGTSTPLAGTFTTLVGTTVNGLTITNNGTNTLTIVAGKTLTVSKTMSFTAADDTGAYTLPTGTKTLVATDVTSLSSLATVGTITSGTWSGSFGTVSGANLTNLTAANVTGSHTLPDGVLSTNVPLLNAANVFTGSNQFGDAVTDSFSVGIAEPTTVSTIYQLFVGTSVFSGQGGAGGEADFGINWYYNSGFKYRTTDYAARVTFNSTSNGNISFETAPSGSADAGITFTPKLAISNAGVVTMGHYGAGTATFDASGNISSVSDARLKDVIGPFQAGLAEVLQLNPVRFKWKEDSPFDKIEEDDPTDKSKGLNKRKIQKHRGTIHAGFVAQEVDAVIPLAVGKTAEFFNYDDRTLIGALVNAIKTLNSRIVALEQA